ncbi:Uncharacterised protein g1489 [Pycnogonum litorale]
MDLRNHPSEASRMLQNDPILEEFERYISSNSCVINVDLKSRRQKCCSCFGNLLIVVSLISIVSVVTVTAVLILVQNDQMNRQRNASISNIAAEQDDSLDWPNDDDVIVKTHLDRSSNNQTSIKNVTVENGNLNSTSVR